MAGEAAHALGECITPEAAPFGESDRPTVAKLLIRNEEEPQS